MGVYRSARPKRGWIRGIDIMTDLVSTAVLVDGSASGDSVLVGNSSAQAFSFGSGSTGDDTISSFGKNDSLLVDIKLFDGNNDGIITFGANGVLDLDGGDKNIDTVVVNGIDGSSGLRYLGTRDGHYAYADATVRPKGVIESKISDDNLTGTNKADTFFFDNALGLFLGNDNIFKFGANDRLVTTSKIYDGNHDGYINFATNQKLDLSGAFGPKDSDPSGDNGPDHPGGQISIYSDAGSTLITQLQYDNVVSHNGVNYYVYSLAGGSNNTSLDFVA